MRVALSCVLAAVAAETSENIKPTWFPKPFKSRRETWHKRVLSQVPLINEEITRKSRKSFATQTATSGTAVSGWLSSTPFASGEQTITDHGDTFLTISLDIGSQKIQAIPDSGSFDLYIVNGADCGLAMCEPAYKPGGSGSNHFEPSPPLAKEIYFGSGACGVELSYDSVVVHNEVGNDPATGVSFMASSPSTPLVPMWLIVEMDEDLASVWGDGIGFQGIVGLGFKGNVHKDSKELLLEEQVMLEAQQKTGMAVLTKPGMASESLFGHVFAICLPRGEDANPVEVLLEANPTTRSSATQDDGRLWWGNSVPPLTYIEIPVVGTRHWTVRVGSAFLQAPESHSDTTYHLCGGGSKAPCAALVDSGTSLIAMSETKINQLLATTVVGSLNPDCSNVDEMPNLVFQMDNGNQLTLTPDTYVMRISTDSSIPFSVLHESSGRVVLESGKKVLNIKPPPKSLFSLKGAATQTVTYCTHAFMETPMETAIVQGTEHELIILGIPVFREYTVKFDREKETLGFSQHPFGTTCHDTNALGQQTSLFEKTSKRSKFRIRSLGNLRDLVFPDEFQIL